MEFVAGGTLQDYWRSFGTAFVPSATAVEVIRQVCRGLTVAHGGTPPLVHRDIKPQNLLVGYEGDGLRVRIADFGLAKWVNPLTLFATALGTLPFKAPEVFENPKGDSCAGDVCAVGCTLYLLLTDRLPWRGLGGKSDEPAARTLGLVSMREFNPKVDPGLERITAKALAWERADRYPDVGPMLVELDAWKPQSAPAEKAKDLNSSVMKTALGPIASPNEARGEQLRKQAMLLALNPTKLNEAADLMEEAFIHLPNLRERFDYRIELWRRWLTN